MTDEYGNKWYIYINADPSSSPSTFLLIIGLGADCVSSVDNYAYISLQYNDVQEHGLDLSKFNPDYSPFYILGGVGAARVWAMECSNGWQWSQYATPMVLSNFVRTPMNDATSCVSCGVGKYSSSTGATSSLTCQSCVFPSFQNNDAASSCSTTTCATNDYLKSTTNVLQVALTWASTSYRSYLGVYTLHTETCNGKPVYKHPHPVYLYYYDEFSPQWVISSTVCSSSRSILFAQTTELVTKTFTGGSGDLAMMWVSSAWSTQTIDMQIYRSEEIGACEDCPVDAPFSPAGSTSVDACYNGCNAGQAFDAYNVCEQCVAGTYQPNSEYTGACIDCPSDSTSPAGSTSEGDCICNAGYENSGADCVACQNGFFKVDIGDHACTACAADSQSISLTACACNAGYIRDGEACEACVVGKYKETVGDTVDCGSGVQSTCCDCGNNPPRTTEGTASTDAAVDCVCIEGAYGATCEFCAVGTYKDAIGTQACTTCPTGSTTLVQGSVALSDCVSAPGFYSVGGGFSECASGTYQFATDQTVCLTCPTGSTSTSLPRTAETDCVCDGVGYQLAVSSSYYCNCQASYYFDSNLATCHACAVDTYCTGVEASDSACPSFSTSPVLSDALVDCQCNAGYSGPDGGTCTACAVEYFKDAVGSAACTACAEHATSPEASDDISDCTCNVGYSGPLGGPCAACTAGTYKDAIGSAECTDCAQHETSPQGSESADACVCQAGYAAESNAFETLSGQHCTGGDLVHSLKHKGVTQAEVDVYGSEENVCKEWCQTDGFGQKPGWVTATCACVSFYPASFSWGGLCYHMTDGYGNYQPYVANSCLGTCYIRISTATSTFSLGPDVSPDITAYVKPETPSVACLDCAAGKYKTTDADTACDGLCPDNSTSPEGSDALTDCVCNAGFSGADGGTCTICPVDKYKDVPGDSVCLDCATNSQSLAGSDAATDCQCNAGYAGPDGGACTECSANFYKSTVGTALCVSCAVNSQSSAASVADTACGCNAGYAGPDGGPCTFCSETQYQPSVGEAACLACPSNSASTVESGRDEQTDCLCNAGYTGADGGVCLACAAGKYKPTTGSAACSDCDVNADNAEASTAVTDCVCNAGYEGVDGALCAACAANHYEDTSTDACVPCPDNSQSPSLSSAATACQCNVGYTGPNGQACTPCLEDEYKDTVGDAVCSSCNNNMYTSAQASTNDLDCLCNAGYSRGISTMRRLLTTSPCQECAVDTYCPVETAVSVNSINDCPDNSQSLTGSDAATDCQCNAGYAGADGGPCSACSENTYKDTIGTAACTDCTEYSSSAAASDAVSDCVCDSPYYAAGDGSCDRTCAAGFEGSGGDESEDTCVGCQQSFYKTTSGTHNCQACPANSHSTVRNQTSIDACVCDQGYLWNGTGCDQCAAGTFNNRANQTACFNCTTSCDTYSRRRRLLTADSWIDVMSCGIVLNGLTSTITTGTIDGQYDASTQSWSLPAGYYITHTGLNLNAVNYLNIFMRFKINMNVNPAADVFMRITNTNGDIIQFHRYIPQGAKGRFIAVNSVGTQSKSYDWNLADGEWIKIMFKMSSGSNPIQIIREDPVNGYNEWFTNSNMNPFTGPFTIYLGGKDSASEISDINLSHFYMSNQDMSWPTDEDLTCASAILPADHTSCPGLCVAPAGYRVNAAGDNVELCPSNHYQDGSASNCTRCPWPSTYSSAGGLTSVAECECRPGYTRFEGVCTACDIGTYKPDAGDAACTACGSHATTQSVASVDVLACVCIAEYEPAAENCIECAEHAYKNIVGNQSCVLCGANSSLLIDSVHVVESCECKPGYESLSVGACTACPHGKFKADFGNVHCDSCGEFTTTAQIASTNQTQCQCILGYEDGPVGGPDVDCAECVCVASCAAGLYGSAGTCQLCEEGKYRDNVDLTVRDCQSCSDLGTGVRTASRVGSVYATNCSCPEGYMGLSSDKFVVVESIERAPDERMVSEVVTAGVLRIAESTNELMRLDIAALSSDVTVSVDLRVVFEARSLHGSVFSVNLQGMRGDLLVQATSGTYTLWTHVEHDITLSASPSWLSESMLQLLRTFALQNKVREGDYVFDSTFYSEVECAVCAQGLVCAEFV